MADMMPSPHSSFMMACRGTLLLIQRGYCMPPPGTIMLADVLARQHQSSGNQGTAHRTTACLLQKSCSPSASKSP